VGQQSGLGGDTAKSTADALVAWSKSVNAAGGIDGHPVEVIVKDDQNIAANAVTAVKDLITNDHVIALVGNHENGLDAAWASYASSKKVPVIGGTATGATYNTDPNFFPVSETGVNAFFGYVYATKLFGKSTYSQVVCAEFAACAQANTLATYYTKALGIKNVAGQSIAAAATSYTAQCEKLKSEGVDLVFTGTVLDVSTRFIQGCAVQGFKPAYTQSGESWKPSVAEDPTWDGQIIMSDAPLWFGDGKGTSAFLAAMQKYAPTSIINGNSTSGWYAGEVFRAAVSAGIKADGGSTVTSQTVYDGLYALGPDFDLGGSIAPVTYTKGKPAAQKLCVWYAQVTNRQLTAPKGTAPVCAPAGVSAPPLG